ncbi:hypothetical protein TrVE_jg2821 [Triparma verrucosa]|uniref:U3 small nucleolar ribonucleoprotein protein MPP10 n=1 Tax=Triparma verrucosa TaxID=1606542 RepID=A0A9W7BFS9_9STRA|nr:hypothetical protein TrVE_jg2821 [Triparma verrucosa]
MAASVEQTLSDLTSLISGDGFLTALLASRRNGVANAEIDSSLGTAAAAMFREVVGGGELVLAGMGGEEIWSQCELVTAGRGKFRGKRVELLELGESDEESDEESDGAERSETEMEPEEGDEEDEEAKRIRERMERSMAAMDDSNSDSDSDVGSESEAEDIGVAVPTSLPRSGESDELSDDGDPMGAPMRDGFFDVLDMEDWADEEERLHFRDADDDEKKEKKRKTRTKKRNEKASTYGGASDSGSDEDVEDEQEQLYRDDDEIGVLARLYDDDSGGDSEEEGDLTAEDFFGKPNSKAMEKYKAKRSDVGVEVSAPVPTSAKEKKLQQQTRELEEEALAEKPWMMTGEVTAAARPADSLLTVAPSFEQPSKLAPTITVEHTENLEDIIKRRILKEDWDDVAPRELPSVTRSKGERAPEVSQEKSKLGLGELYERDYLKAAVGYDKDKVELETAEGKAKSEMKALFAKLCSKLDALSNYHFSPRPASEVAEVKSQAPAIAMEEVIPLTVSDARSSAPEEVFGGKRGRDSVLKADSEMDSGERKRLRATKKAKRRKERAAKQADEKLVSRLKPGLGLSNPYEARKLRDDLAKARSSGKVVDGGIEANDDFNTSTKFFERMQRQVAEDVHGDGTQGGAEKKKKSRGGNSSSLVLS